MNCSKIINFIVNIVMKCKLGCRTICLKMTLKETFIFSNKMNFFWKSFIFGIFVISFLFFYWNSISICPICIKMEMISTLHLNTLCGKLFDLITSEQSTNHHQHIKTNFLISFTAFFLVEAMEHPKTYFKLFGHFKISSNDGFPLVELIKK